MSKTKPEHLGHAALVGWRKTVAERVAGPAAQRTPLSEDQVRGVIGAAFLLLSAYYVISSLTRFGKAAAA
jgi:hypothetical protein